MPLLSVEGRGVFAQSHAQMRFAAKLGGVYPTDPFLAAQVDEALDCALPPPFSNTAVYREPSQPLRAWCSAAAVAFKSGLVNTKSPLADWSFLPLQT